MNLYLGGMKLNSEKIYIDDTPSDFSDALTFENDEEYEKYREQRRLEIEKESKQ